MTTARATLWLVTSAIERLPGLAPLDPTPLLLWNTTLDNAPANPRDSPERCLPARKLGITEFAPD